MPPTEPRLRGRRNVQASISEVSWRESFDKYSAPTRWFKTRPVCAGRSAPARRAGAIERVGCSENHSAVDPYDTLSESHYEGGCYNAVAGGLLGDLLSSLAPSRQAYAAPKRNMAVTSPSTA